MALYETIGFNNFIILQDFSIISFDFILWFDLYSLMRNQISYQLSIIYPFLLIKMVAAGIACAISNAILPKNFFRRPNR